MERTVSDAEEKMDTEKFCQHASVSFALATIEKRNTDYPYGEHFRELVENAKRDLLRFRQVSRVKAGLPEAERLKMEEQELDLFEGTVYLELFRLRMADGNYEEALRLLARCMAGLGAAAPADRDWIEPAPPVNDLQADEAAACFERLSTEPTRVKTGKTLHCHVAWFTSPGTPVGWIVHSGYTKTKRGFIGLLENIGQGRWQLQSPN